MLPQFRAYLDPTKVGMVVGGGRSRGASTAMAQAVVYLASKCRMRICVAREYQNSISDSSKAEIEKVITSDPNLESSWIVRDQYLMHRYTESSVIFKGISRHPNSFKSIANLDLLIIEEAEELSWNSWKVIEPSVRKRGAEIWLIGNNRKRTSVFGTLFQNPPKGWIRLFNTYLENPYNTPEQLEKAEYCRRVYGDAAYRNIWLGEWEDLSQMNLVRQIVTEDDSTPAPEPHDCVVIGVDIARKGGDKCVLAVRRGRRIIAMQVYDSMDLDLLAAVIRTAIVTYRPSAVYIDSTGSGLWAPEALAAKGVDVTEVNFAGAADDPEEFHNRRAEMYGRLNRYFLNGGTVPANEHELIEELRNTPYRWDNKNRVQMLLKDEISTMLGQGRSPDRADAVALTMCWEPMFTDPNRDIVVIESKKAVNARFLMGARVK